MPKSKYPNQLDTSVEIPVVRDNITEIGSDVLNSLRSALFQIEKTLGINPQGAIGNTVAARLANVLDENGNLLKVALDRSSILSGPIGNEDVSKVAAIDESKLKLQYPTQLLQDEISQISNRLQNLIDTLEELNRIVSAHVHEDAIDRHKAVAITVASADIDASTSATMELADGTLQEALEELYNAHIYYTGESISSTNSSHLANQIFYNNEDYSTIIPSDDVQGALDDLAAIEEKSLKNVNLNFNSNGIVRTGSTYDAFEENDEGSVLVEESAITYSGPNAASKDRVSFTSQPSFNGTISKFDIFTMIGSPNEDDNRDYVIADVELTGDGLGVDYIDVYGQPLSSYVAGITGQITKGKYTNYNENGFNCVVRPRYDRTNTPDIHVALPNAATIISSGLRADGIVSGTSDTIAIKIDGEDAVKIEVYDSNFDVQTLDTIVNMINTYSVENKLNIMAYKMRSLRCYELAITHIVPNFADDVKNRTLEITAASEQDATSTLGLSYILDREVEGLYGNAYHINGALLKTFNTRIAYTSTTIQINMGTANLSTTSNNFFEDGVRIGDICVISGSSVSTDDGTYRITSVNDELLSLDYLGSVLEGELGDDSALYILRSSAPVGEMEFDEIAGNGSILFDVFLTEDMDIFFDKRMLIASSFKDPNFYASIVDASYGFITDGDEASLTITTDRYATLTDPTSVSGEAVFVAGGGTYKIYSSDKMSYIVLEVHTTGAPTSNMTVEITGYSEPSRACLHLCRGTYSTDMGMVLGDSGLGVPRTIDKRTTGTVDDTIISEPFLERYIQGPRNDLRGNGVIRNGLVSSVDNSAGDGTCLITIDPGVLVVNGIRFEYLGIQDMLYTHSPTGTVTASTDDFYIAIDGEGCIQVENKVEDPDNPGEYFSPFKDQDILHLAYINVTSSTENTVYDLRLYVSRLDYKVTKNLIVANNRELGHFTSINEAVIYSEHFTKLFPNSGTPTIHIREGEYKITEAIEIYHDLILKGSGPNTIITRDPSYPPGGTTARSISDPLFKIGYFSTDDLIVSGVELRDFTYKGLEDLSAGVGDSVIMLKHNLLNSSGGNVEAHFAIRNIKFIGASDYVVDNSSSNINDWDNDSTPNETPIHIGNSQDGLYSNIIISGCQFEGIGYGEGVVYLNPDNDFENINVFGNISIGAIHSDHGLVCYRNVDSAGLGKTLTGFQETSNVIKYES